MKTHLAPRYTAWFFPPWYLQLQSQMSAMHCISKTFTVSLGSRVLFKPDAMTMHCAFHGSVDISMGRHTSGPHWMLKTSFHGRILGSSL